MRIARVALLLTLMGCASTPTTPTLVRSCRVNQTVAQSIPSGAATVVTYNDLSGCSFAQADQLVLPAGVWAVHAQLTWAPNTTGLRGMSLFVGDDKASVAGSLPMTNGIVTIQTVVAHVTSDGATIVRVTGSQNSGAPIATYITGNPDAVATFLTATRIE